MWHARRWRCPEADCAEGSWTEEDHRIAAPRQVLTARAARWATVQLGRRARSVNEVADELACDWHTVNDTVVAYGEALLAARSLGGTLIRWHKEIAARHEDHVSNGPTEAVNNLIKRVKRAAFGLASLRDYRLCAASRG